MSAEPMPAEPLPAEPMAAEPLPVEASRVAPEIGLGGSVVEVASAADVVDARQKGRALAGTLGFSACDQTVIATAISELARNIIEYAREGRIAISTVRLGEHLGIVIEASDEGPGIADPPRAVAEGGGAGFGLPGIRR